MPIFDYKAKKQNAETVTGEVFAQSREDAVEKISKLGLMPVEVTDRAEVTAKNSPGSSKHGRVRRKTLSVFSRQLVNLLKAGVPILRAMEILAQQTRDQNFKNVIMEIRTQVREGKTLSDSMAGYPRIFMPLYVTMVRAGEESGNLKETINDMSEYLIKQEEVASKIRTASVYPALMFFFGIGTIVFILTYVMPQISGLFVNMQQQLPGPTVFVMKVSQFLIKMWMWLIAGLVLGFVAVSKWAVSKAGRLTLSHAVLKLPFFGAFCLKVELSRFCRTLALLMKSGIPIVRALQLSGPAVGNEIVRSQIEKCQKDILAGRAFGAAIKDARLIPEMVGHLISIGEESGSLAATLQDISDNYEQETNEAIKIMTTVIEPLMIIFVGSIVGFIVIAMLLPIFELDIMAR